jgi:DNA helicase-2/ATP-dependent DNA helicase PcrA
LIGGLRFYDRVEVKTILDYLRVINQPENNDALARIINTPSRRIGETTVKSLLEEAEQAKTTLWALILGAVQRKRMAKTKLTKAVEQNLSVFVNIILSAQKKIADPSGQQSSIVKTIQFVLEKTSYEKWLEEHHADVHKARWDNVKELITQASDFQGQISNGLEDESLPEIEGLEQQDASDALSRFLANVALASEVRKEDDDASSTPQVTISTIHAAKGLEWPVVFIPAAYQGSIPHSRAEDTDEERRLLYVAMTRAKALLYLSCPLKNSLGEQTTMCPFLTARTLRPLLDHKGPSLGSIVVQSLSQILRRSLPSKESIIQSSACLELTEDTYYPLEAEDDKEDESRWNGSSGNPSFTMGQRLPKRRRTETNEPRDVTSSLYNATPTTTMDMASRFTSNTGFISAGSHLKVLAEQAPNQTVADNPGRPRVAVTTKHLAKARKGVSENQGTLLGFLGKPEPPKYVSQQLVNPDAEKARLNTDLHRPRNTGSLQVMRPPALPDKEDIELPSLLGAHRPGTSAALLRPGSIRSQATEKHDYIFLSSSPPSAKQSIRHIDPDPVAPPPGLTAKPAIMSLVRPARTLHTTSMSLVQAAPTTKKTLGVKRSMNGWSNRQTQPFVPPTMKKRN